MRFPRLVPFLAVASVVIAAAVPGPEGAVGAASPDPESRAGVTAPVPTRLTVRVLSKDAKFIGTTMGGVRIVVRDADSGEVLAEGTTRGSTGDTQRIMKQDWKRGVPLATPDSAAFTATIPLAAPRRVEVVAIGPGGQPQAGARASVTHWLIPGRHIDQGDALLIVLPGLALDVLEPPAMARFTGVPATVTVRANLVML